MATTYNVVSNFSTTLSTSITSTQTIIPVSSVTTQDGHVLTMADLGAEVYLVFEPGTPNMEICKCTSVSNSPAQFSGAIRGLAFYGDSEVSVTTNQLPHNAGSIVIMSNDNHQWKRAVDRESDQTISGIKTFTNLPTIPLTPVNPTDVASKGYVDSVVVSGAPNATLIVKGISQLGADAQLQSGTEIGTTGASVVAHGNNFNQTPTANKVPVSDGANKLDDGWLHKATPNGLASLDASSLVVQNPASASSTPGASKIPIADSGGELNTWLNENRLNVQTYIAGENIDSTVNPIPVYVKSTDGKVYKSSGISASEAAYSFKGFAIFGQNITLGNSIKVQTDGLVNGFTTALTAGATYYLSNTTGIISTTPGNLPLRVGIADNTTTKLLISTFSSRHYNGTVVISGAGNTVITTGFSPGKISIFAYNSTPINSFGGWNAASGNKCVCYISGTGPAQFNNAYYTSNGGNSYIGDVTSITSTGFTIATAASGVLATNTYLFWEAQQ